MRSYFSLNYCSTEVGRTQRHQSVICVSKRSSNDLRKPLTQTRKTATRVVILCPARSSCCILSNWYQLYCFQYITADRFFVSASVVLFAVRSTSSVCVYLFHYTYDCAIRSCHPSHSMPLASIPLKIIITKRENLSSDGGQNPSVDRTFQLVVSSSIWPITELCSRQILSTTESLDKFYSFVMTRRRVANPALDVVN